jgi:hypothetical protein
MTYLSFQWLKHRVFDIKNKCIYYKWWTSKNEKWQLWTSWFDFGDFENLSLRCGPHGELQTIIKGINCAFVMGLGCWEGCMSFWLVPNPIQIWITLNALVLYFVWFTCSRVDYNKLQFLLVILKFSPLWACCGKLWSMPRGFNSILGKLKMSVDSP